jgi:hypothetical protein
MTLTDEQVQQQVAWINDAIETVDGSREEMDALKEIFDVEGFGGEEDFVMNFKDAQRLATEKLEWLRGQREEGLRW